LDSFKQGCRVKQNGAPAPALGPGIVKALLQTLASKRFEHMIALKKNMCFERKYMFLEKKVCKYFLKTCFPFAKTRFSKRKT